jgi:hypothetical protein
MNTVSSATTDCNEILIVLTLTKARHLITGKGQKHSSAQTKTCGFESLRLLNEKSLIMNSLM